MVAYTITLNTVARVEAAERKIKRLERGIDKLKGKSDKALDGLGGGAFAIRGIATEVSNQVRTLTVGLGVLAAAIGLVGREAINASADFELLAVSLDVLAGSTQEADVLLRNLKTFAAETPLQLKDIEDSSVVLLALGESAASVIPIIERLGQAAVALRKPLSQFIRARNLLSQGVVLTRTLAPLGISREILEEFGAGAAATGEQLVAAFDEALGRFEGLFERTFNTVSGQLSNLKDIFDLAFAAIGDSARDQTLKVIGFLNQFLVNIRTFAEKNREILEESFQIIVDRFKVIFGPITTLFDNLFKAINKDPTILKDLANGFVNLTTALGGLVIIGTVTASLLSLVAAVTLLRIALPQLTLTILPLIGALRGLAVSLALIPAAAIASPFAALGVTASATTTAITGLIPFLSKLGGLLVRFAPQIIIIVLAIRNLEETLNLLGSALRVIIDFIGLILAPLDAFFGLLFGGNTTMQVLDFGFRQFLVTLELLIRSISVAIEFVKNLFGASNDLDGSWNRLTDTSVRLAEAFGLIGPKIDAFNNELERLEIFAREAGISVDDARIAINAIDTSGAISQLDQLIGTFTDLTIASQQAALNMALAQGVIQERPEQARRGGRPGTTQQEGFIIGPLGRDLTLGQGFSLEAIADAIRANFEGIDRETLLDALGFGDVGGGGAAGGQTEAEKFAETIRRIRISLLETTERLNLGLITLTDSTQEVNLARRSEIDALISFKTIAGLTSEQQEQLNNLTIKYLETLELLTAEPTVFKRLSDSISGVISSIDTFINSLRDKIQGFLDQIGIFTEQQKIFNAAFVEAFLGLDPRTQGRLALETNIADQPGFEGLRQFLDRITSIIDSFSEFGGDEISETINIFDDFLRGFAEEITRLLKGIGDITDILIERDVDPKTAGFINDIFGLGAKAFGKSLFGKDGFAKGGLFGTEGLLGGLGPDLISSAALGLGGFAINRFFGKEPEIEIKGPVDVNIIDIQGNALNLFNFRGIEAFTFSSRFRPGFGGTL